MFCVKSRMHNLGSFKICECCQSDLFVVSLFLFPFRMRVHVDGYSGIQLQKSPNHLTCKFYP